MRTKIKGSKQDSQKKTTGSTKKQNIVGWGVIMLLGICE